MHRCTKIIISLVLIGICLVPNLASAQDVINQSKFTIGDTVEFRSSVLDEDRKLNIYLPQSYSKDANKKYPVIYLLDGSEDEDFIHIAGLVQFGSFDWIKMIPETIVVGIANVDRKRDFTFATTDEKYKKEFPTCGGSGQFIEMLETEIQPLINKTYRTNDSTTIIGQSLAGLLATEILFKKPGLFDNYIIVSPSLWWDERSLLNTKTKPVPEGISIFVGVGNEGDEMKELAQALHDKIKSNKSDKCRLWFEYFSELDHGDTLHLATYNAFEKIFAESQR